ncbi:hypothetical protein [Gimesia maris]|uniref:hypothetical protein n=1 Tax=Gimesia maris TaxID=122 RepID=UPI0030DC602B|tara:strand:- start:26377 stop:26580 length:204 start_codon:yes stop_codon:yes gene_type:complete
MDSINQVIDEWLVLRDPSSDDDKFIDPKGNDTNDIGEVKLYTSEKDTKDNGPLYEPRPLKDFWPLKN